MPYTKFIDSFSVNKVSHFNCLYTIKSYQTQTPYSRWDKSAPGTIYSLTTQPLKLSFNSIQALKTEKMTVSVYFQSMSHQTIAKSKISASIFLGKKA